MQQHELENLSHQKENGENFQKLNFPPLNQRRAAFTKV